MDESAWRKLELLSTLEPETRPAQSDEIALRRYLATVSSVSPAHVAVLLAAARRDRALDPRHAAFAADDDEVIQHLEGLYWLAQAENVLGHPDAALRTCERGLRLAEQRRLGAAVAQFTAALGVLSPPLGEPDDARQAGDGDEARRKLDSLSGRELQIAFLVTEGRTNEQIARKLELSHKTVETYLARIFRKLAVTCRAEIAAMVGRSGR